MFRKRLREEAGYTLVEVMVSIVILSLAILPMASMFDTGLKSATASSNYDKARALSTLKMEQTKSLPFATVRDNFPVTGTTYNGSGFYQSAWLTESGPASADFTAFHYRVNKQYIAQPSQTPTSTSENFNTSTSATNLIRVTVIVGWGTYDSSTDTYSNTYTTCGLVTA